MQNLVSRVFGPHVSRIAAALISLLLQGFLNGSGFSDHVIALGSRGQYCPPCAHPENPIFTPSFKLTLAVFSETKLASSPYFSHSQIGSTRIESGAAAVRMSGSSAV